MMLRQLMCGIVALSCAGIASAGITVRDGQLDKPDDYLTNPNRIVQDFQFLPPNPDDPNDPPPDRQIGQSFTVPNGYIPENIKYFWMEVKMDTANGFPQDSGRLLDEALWPGVEGITTDPVGVTHETTVRRAATFSDFANNDWRWYFEVIIDPQPFSETVTFQQMWWDTWGAQITEINIQTVCVPTPGGVLMLAVGVGVATTRRRR